MQASELYDKSDKASTRLAYRRREAAAALGISTRSFDRLVAAGIIPTGRKLGCVRVWTVADLEAALEGGVA